MASALRDGRHWWVIDCNKTKVVGPLYSKRNAEEEAAVLNNEGLPEFRPYTTFNDIDHVCRHCGAKVFHVPGHSGRYAYSKRADGTDIFGSGSECPKNERGHEPAADKGDSPKCAVCSESIRYDAGVGWLHPHSGDRECWTGDGSTAYPAHINT